MLAKPAYPIGVPRIGTTEVGYPGRPWLLANFMDGHETRFRNHADGNFCSHATGPAPSSTTQRPNDHGIGLHSEQGTGTGSSSVVTFTGTAGIGVPPVGTFDEYTIAMTVRYDTAGASSHGKTLFFCNGNSGGLQLRYHPYGAARPFQVWHRATSVTYNFGLTGHSTYMESEMCAIVVTYFQARVNICFNGEHLAQIINLTQPHSLGNYIYLPTSPTAKTQVAFGGDYGMVYFGNKAWSHTQARRFALDPYEMFRSNRHVRDQSVPIVITPETPPERGPSETSIANGALVLLGERRINSLLDDSRVARILNDRFDDVRDELLRAMPWSFATKRATLAPDAAAPVWKWRARYPLPSDCIRVLEVDNEQDGRGIPAREWDWSVEANALHTNLVAPIKITYTARIKNPREMDSIFRQTFSALLAVEVAEAITGSSEKLRQVWGRYVEAVRIAATVNGQEDPVDADIPGEWERQRGREDRSR